METLALEKIIEDSLKRSISYKEYRDLVEKLVTEKSTTGDEKTEALAAYTVLNNRRMKRWDKTLKISETEKKRIANFHQNVTWLVITESWCGDAAHVIPVLNKIAELSERIDLRLVLRDENDLLMNQFLTNGGRAIAKLVMLDHKHNVLGTFGPRPSMATELVNNYKAKHGKLTPEFKEKLQTWYNKDKGQNVVSDVLDLLDL
ncbi:MAG: thioredoxin family protein [Bacteroidota bacterium]